MGKLVQVGRFSVPVSGNLEFELTNTFFFLLVETLLHNKG